MIGVRTTSRQRASHRAVGALVAIGILGSCAAADGDRRALTPGSTTPSATDAPTTTPDTTAPETSGRDTVASTTPSSIEPEPTTEPTSPRETIAPTTTTAPTFDAIDLAWSTLSTAPAASLTVRRDGEVVVARSHGVTQGGDPLTSDTAMVIASVSKLITMLTVARLDQNGLLDVDDVVPWDRIGVPTDPAWRDVTINELLTHTAGMPKAQKSWLNDPGPCAAPLAAAVAAPPTPDRGEWVYSNGNYCALGMLIEAISATTFDEAARDLVFEPAGIEGPHLIADVDAADGPYPLGVARLARLGAAGTWMASTDDLAAMLDTVTPADRETLTPLAIISDQYGWGHTGTVDGAKSCAWVMEYGRTVVVATVAGGKPATGGALCDLVVVAVATDLGIGAGEPNRFPD